MSRMAARAPELFSSHTETEESTTAKENPSYAADDTSEFSPLQLEHMLGFAGEHRKTILAFPDNENLYVKR